MKTMILTWVIAASIAGTDTVGAEPETDMSFKSKGTATSLALAGLLVPYGAAALALPDDGSGSPAVAAAVLAGMIVGPGLGHAYAGEKGRFWKGTAIRTLAAASIIVGLEEFGDGENDLNIIVLGGSAIYLYSAIRDVVTASNSVERHNEKVRSGGLSVAPLWRPRDRAVGMSVTVDF